MGKLKEMALSYQQWVSGNWRVAILATLIAFLIAWFFWQKGREETGEQSRLVSNQGQIRTTQEKENGELERQLKEKDKTINLVEALNAKLEEDLNRCRGECKPPETPKKKAKKGGQKKKVEAKVVVVPSPAKDVAQAPPPKAAVAVVAESPKEDFYDKAVMPKTMVTEQKEEVAETEPPRVSRKVYVIRQQPAMPYYGGYNTGYSYAPQVVYGNQYVPPPQTVFVPAAPVVVPAPSVVAPAPSVVVPAGGYRPQGATGGHSPSGTTGAAL